jgi:hypothetical protein
VFPKNIADGVTTGNPRCRLGNNGMKYLHVFAAFDDNGGGRDGKQTGPNTDKTKNLEVVTSSTVFRIPDSVITVRD